MASSNNSASAGVREEYREQRTPFLIGEERAGGVLVVDKSFPITAKAVFGSTNTSMMINI